MDNSINSMSNISMRGNLIVTAWKHNRPISQHYKTTKAQDKLVKLFVDQNVALCEDAVLSHSNSDFIHKLFELFTGKNFNNIKAKKNIYNDGQEVYFTDTNFKLADGVEFNLKFD